MKLPLSLLPLPNGEIIVLLPSGKVADLPICHPVFSLWSGQSVDFDYGGKPLINYEGEAIFAELAILRILLADGWDGVWVETYGGTNFLRDMPHDWKLKPQNIAIPKDKQNLLQDIWKTGKTKACFDVFV